MQPLYPSPQQHQPPPYGAPRQAAPVPNLPPAPGIVGVRHAPGRRSRGLTGMFERIFRTIKDRPWRAFSLVAAVAMGVTISIAIIGAGDGVQKAVSDFLGGIPNHGDLSQASCQDPNTGLDPCRIQLILDHTQSLLVRLAIIFTAALVALITWITMGQRRRDIGIAISNGQRRGDVITELVVEALILCTVGGIVGVILGDITCSALTNALNPLTLPFKTSDVMWLFPITTLLSFGATAVVAVYYASKPDTSVGL
jgi:hypothetical protein